MSVQLYKAVMLHLYMKKFLHLVRKYYKIISAFRSYLLEKMFVQKHTQDYYLDTGAMM